MASKPMKTINFGGEDIYYLNPDFENIDNSPFETIGGDTLTWDGNTEGLENIDGAFWKISDAAPSIEELSHGYSLTIRSPEGENTFTEADVPIPETGPVIIGEFCIIIPEDTNGDGFVIGKGTYFLGDSTTYTSSFTINGYTGFTITKLKSEYLPVDYIRQLIAEVTGN